MSYLKIFNIDLNFYESCEETTVDKEQHEQTSLNFVVNIKDVQLKSETDWYECSQKNCSAF